MKCKLNIDGGSRGNPGPAAAGIVLFDLDKQISIAEIGYFLGTMTNNGAEYNALLRGIELAEKLLVKHLHIQSDSQLVVRQVLGQYRIKSDSLRPLLYKVQNKLNKLPDWKIEHVKRDQNKQADLLANKAMDAKADVILVKDYMTIR